ncbi:hypothetical protein ANOM_011378 [Aspergillus nomiae NRRL 13137]|uniref:AMP-dependent synthetase/ligase domain-containing protein n=1 Tax=Aspergillus nomiae NRRL (strain ATCC 15546 / NRRL 13137 / CBS 260.88 / M93) TaxID=1509407 RepID=A0A0L1IL41_ASPN3|nr:uncharacterized protein ANOM_011378 [Aspergillus nomiae NRRL 13137]KNG80237.1 hypothetical protein ANOM_011378 [Aspergillus nomiae NRRL 13137]
MAPIIEQLPNEPLFDHLLHSFTAHPRHVLVHDPKNGVEADCSQLLTDILHMRHQIFQALPASSFDAQRRIDPENPYVIVLAPGNYDYIVAALSTLACGGAFAPICKKAQYVSPGRGLPPSGNDQCIMHARFTPIRGPGSQIARYYAARNKSVAIIPIAVNNAPAAPRPLVRIDPAMMLDPTSPGVLLFTSGTTGPPKGVQPCRAGFPVTTLGRCGYESDMAGLAGTRVEVIENDPRVIWESFCTARVSHFGAPARTYAQLMKYFEEHIDCLPVEQRSRYVKGVRALQRVIVSGGVTWPTVMGFWRELLGRPLRNMYSSTEVTAAMETTEDSDPNLERCIGKPCRGVQVKLSDGDHGEILLKSATMFTHYLGNEAATRAVFDEEGYYKSGDFGHLVGDHLRLSASFHYMRQVAAVIRPETSKAAVSLSQIRVDLQDKLQRYKLPTLLRTLHDNEQVPETTSGKPLRRKMEEKYFSLPEEPPLPAGVEFCDTDVGTEETPRRAWDWGGMM